MAVSHIDPTLDEDRGAVFMFCGEGFNDGSVLVTILKCWGVIAHPPTDTTDVADDVGDAVPDPIHLHIGEQVMDGDARELLATQAG
jgi:methionine-rich copper-binding protein CopC